MSYKIALTRMNLQAIKPLWLVKDTPLPFISSAFLYKRAEEQKGRVLNKLERCRGVEPSRRKDAGRPAYIACSAIDTTLRVFDKPLEVY
jgi:hypothetical protein